MYIEGSANQCEIRNKHNEKKKTMEKPTNSIHVYNAHA